jgi:MFS family permease
MPSCRCDIIRTMAGEVEEATAPDAAEKMITREFVLLFVAGFLCMGSLYLLIPVLPLYMSDVVKASTTQVGLLVGLLTFSSMLFRPFVGRKSDEVGRKVFLLIGATVFIVAPLLYVPARSTWALPFVLLFNGFGIACYHTASLTFIGEIAPSSQRGKSQAWFQTSFNLSVMVAPPLAILIKDVFGYNWVFVSASIAGALSLAISLLINERMAPGRPAPAESALKGPGMRRLLVLVCVGVFASTTTLGTVEAFLGLFAQAEGIAHFALFFTISGGLLILIRLAFGGLIDTLGRKLTGFLALAALGASMVILAVANGFAMVCVSAIVWGAGFSFASPAFSAMLMDCVPHEELGRAFGIFTAAFEGGIVFGAMLMGPVVTALGYRTAFVIIGCVCLAGALFFLTAYRALSLPISSPTKLP